MPQAPDERLICAGHAIFSEKSVHEMITLTVILQWRG